jgi:hypothetical protein
MEKVFKPVLIPICDALMHQLQRDTPWVSVAGDWDIIKRYNLSGALNEAALSQGVKSLFNDQLDGIEIRNLKLKFLNRC